MNQQAVNQDDQAKYSSLFRSESVLEHQNKCLANLLKVERQTNEKMKEQVKACDDSLGHLLDSLQKSECLLKMMANQPNQFSSTTQSPNDGGNQKESSIVDFIASKLTNDSKNGYYRNLAPVVQQLFKEKSRDVSLLSQTIVSFIENLVKQVIEEKSKTVSITLKQSGPAAQKIDDSELLQSKLQIQDLETKISQLNQGKDRNQNYYFSIMRQFFEGEAEKVSNSLQNQPCHECRCNLCGTDIQKKAEAHAAEKIDEKIKEIKAEMQKEVKTSQFASSDTSEETKKKLEDLEGKNNMLQLQISELTGINQKLNEDIQRQESQRDSTSINVQVSKMKKYCQQLCDQLAEERQRNAELRKQQSRMNGVHHDRQSDSVSKHTLDKLNSELHHKNRLMEKLRDDYGKLAHEIRTELAPKLSQLEKNKVDAEMKQANQEAKTPAESFQLVHKKLTEQHEVDCLKMTELDQQLKQIKQRYEHYKKKCLQSEQATKKIQSDLDKVQKDYDTLKSQPQRLQDLQSLPDAQKELFEKHEKLKKMYHEQCKLKSDADKKYEMKSKELEQESYQREQIEQSLRQKEESLVQKTQVINEIYGQIDQLYEGQANCDSQLSSLQEENDRLKVHNSDLEIRACGMLKDRDLAMAESKEFQLKLNLAESQLTALKSLEELTSRQKALENSLSDQLETQKQQFKSQIAMLQEQQRNMLTIYYSMKAELDQHKASVDELQKNKVQLLSEKDQLQAKLSSSVKSMADLKHKMLNSAGDQRRNDVNGSSDGKVNFSQDQLIKMLRHKQKRLLQQVNCSNCQLQPKDTVLPCGHLFCEKCVDAQMKDRKRTCPACGVKFTASDKKKIYMCLNEDDEDADMINDNPRPLKRSRMKHVDDE